jgi:hypothetical protein
LLTTTNFAQLTRKQSLEHLMQHISQSRRGSFTEGSAEAEELGKLQALGRQWQTEHGEKLLRSQSVKLSDNTKTQEGEEGVKEEQAEETETPAPPPMPATSGEEAPKEEEAEVAKDEQVEQETVAQQEESPKEEEGEVECAAPTPTPEAETESPVPTSARDKAEKRETRPTSAQTAIRVQQFEFSA